MSDLNALEQAFAKDKSLDTCLLLCDAYLGASRYMEAMVVCKKGIRTSPDDPRGHVALAQVYLEQGKIPKAQKEIDLVAAANPNDPSVLETRGRVAMKNGDAQGAVPFFQQALSSIHLI